MHSHFYIPSSFSPKGIYLIFKNETKAIEISNKLKKNCVGVNNIFLT